MKPIDKDLLAEKLDAFAGRTSFAHLEVTPGGFARNVVVQIENTHVHGSGPYRVALRLKGNGWIRIEGLTHMTVDEAGRLLIAGHDSDGKLTTGLELSKEAFA
ncbi:hypothetical protein SD70_07145 [Gordoniibacillus kamchatkensis]|uniref:Adhesin n=1 Tax=Gordoniibacillus kamchatkensis TaxID=1590651 RepID=A0ABR5AK61_9BACL|nr:DUF1806 family protein [Paenibacillus sp. VKM B-2647]KIL41416.1 hypothetical protein SD70_07145 [Paenibacillus sp. VKM B-2647]